MAFSEYMNFKQRTRLSKEMSFRSHTFSIDWVITLIEFSKPLTTFQNLVKLWPFILEIKKNHKRQSAGFLLRNPLTLNDLGMRMVFSKIIWSKVNILWEGHTIWKNLNKGQIISLAIYLGFKSPKKQTIFFEGFLP